MSDPESPPPGAPARDRCRNYIPDELVLPPPWEYEIGSEPGRRRLYPATFGPADELNRKAHGYWNWIRVNDPEEPEHWSLFQGHRTQIDVEMSTCNVRNTNDWKGRDEVRKAGHWKLFLDRTHVGQGEVYDDPLDALITIRRYARRMILLGDQLIHGKDVGMPGSWRYGAVALADRKVYYHNDPARVGAVLLDQGAVTLKPDGIESFTKPAWWTDDDWDEYRGGLLVGLLSEQIHWHRE